MIVARCLSSLLSDSCYPRSLYDNAISDVLSQLGDEELALAHLISLSAQTMFRVDYERALFLLRAMRAPTGDNETPVRDLNTQLSPMLQLLFTISQGNSNKV